jgi:hypothetical protein
MKTCTKCGIEKDESDYRHWHNECKKCECASNKDYRLKNKEKIAEKQKEYHKINPNKRKEMWGNWYLKNRERLIEKATKKAKEYPEISQKYNLISYLRNRDKRIEYNKKYELQNNDTVTYKKSYRYYKSELTKQIGETPPPELVEVKLLINKTKRLCKTLKN